MPLLLLFALALVVPFTQAQTLTRDERWKQDLDTLTTQLTERHPNLFANVSRADFEQAAARIAASIPQRGDASLTVDLMRLVAMAGDAHTSVQPYSGTNPLPVLPLRIRWFSDGLFVTHAAAA